MTIAQIEKSPSIDEAKPVSRQQEVEYNAYYDWPLYWQGPPLTGSALYPGPHGPLLVRPVEGGEPEEKAEQRQDSHLRSTREVTGYSLAAEDGEIGQVKDFIVEDGDWVIRYLEVDTGNWWPGKRVLMPPEWVESVDWPASQVLVNLPRESVKSAPEYDPTLPITREDEERFFRHYRREGYWMSGRGSEKQPSPRPVKS